MMKEINWGPGDFDVVKPVIDTVKQ